MTKSDMSSRNLEVLRAILSDSENPVVKELPSNINEWERLDTETKQMIEDTLSGSMSYDDNGEPTGNTLILEDIQDQLLKILYPERW